MLWCPSIRCRPKSGESGPAGHGFPNRPNWPLPVSTPPPARPLARPSVRPSVRPHTRYTRADADVNFRLPCPRLSTWFSFPFFFSLPKKACYTNSFLPISFWLPASFWARRKDKTRQGVNWKEKKFLEREICRKNKRETLLVIQTQKEMPWHHPTSLFPLVLKLSGFSSPSCELALCHLLKGHIHIGFGGGGGEEGWCCLGLGFNNLTQFVYI